MGHRLGQEGSLNFPLHSSIPTGSRYERIYQYMEMRRELALISCGSIVSRIVLCIVSISVVVQEDGKQSACYLALHASL